MKIFICMFFFFSIVSQTQASPNDTSVIKECTLMKSSKKEKELLQVLKNKNLMNKQ